MAEPAREPIESPCINVCMVSGRTGMCVGCYRTLPEIARWSRYTAAERSEIMAALPARAQAAEAAR